MNFSVSIIIPNYNGEDLLRKNLDSVVKAARYPQNSISEIIIVDDGSKDKSVSYIKNTYPIIKVVQHRKNRGFPAAINTGVRTSKGDLLVLLNNDVVPEQAFVEKALKYFQDPKLFAVSLHEKGYGWARAKFENGFIVHSSGDEDDKPHNTFWVSGGSGVFRRNLFIKLGSMDERLFSPFYWEDIDLAYRALKRGYKLLWIPDSFVTHVHESTTKKIRTNYRRRIQERNQLLFIWKNLTSPRLKRKHIIGLFSRIFRHPGYLKIVILALVKLPLVLKAKKKQRKFEKVSDEAILASFK